jgi:HSP20 family protein
MAIVRWSPFFNSALSQWPDLWDDAVNTLQSASNNLDVYETENEVVVRANVAGVTEKDIDITFEKGVLWIKAERTEESNDSKEDKKHYSRSSWSYSYKVGVPGMLDHNEDPDVDLKDGMLVIRFKKSAASKPKKLTVKKSK